MSVTRFDIIRNADQFLPHRSFAVTASTVVPDDPMRAVRVYIWQDASPMTGHVVADASFALSLQERKDLIAFLQSLPDADHPF